MACLKLAITFLGMLMFLPCVAMDEEELFRYLPPSVYVRALNQEDLVQLQQKVHNKYEIFNCPYFFKKDFPLDGPAKFSQEKFYMDRDNSEAICCAVYQLSNGIYFSLTFKPEEKYPWEESSQSSDIVIEGGETDWWEWETKEKRNTNLEERLKDAISKGHVLRSSCGLECCGSKTEAEDLLKAHQSLVKEYAQTLTPKDRKDFYAGL